MLNTGKPYIKNINGSSTVMFSHSVN